MSLSKNWSTSCSCSHRLRHRSVENLHHGRKADEIDKVLHGVPLNPFLRPRLCENPGPHPCASRHLIEAVVGGCGQGHRDALLLMSPP